MRTLNLTQQRFGRLTVIGRADGNYTRPHWNCVCDCGKKIIVARGNLRRGQESCGCLVRAQNSFRLTTHGMRRHPAYGAWVRMRSRCSNESTTNFECWGGRGIKVCDQWSTFEAFWQDMGPTWTKGLSLDRINVDGDYEPGNCRWATSATQSNNRRNNHFIPTPLGMKTISEASRIYGIDKNTLHARATRYNWPDEYLLKPKGFRVPK